MQEQAKAPLRNILLVVCLTESAETFPGNVNERPSGLDPEAPLDPFHNSQSESNERTFRNRRFTF
jgi:hypothetical protein